MPGDRQGQRERLEAVLRSGSAITEPGQIVELDYEYPTGAVGVPEDLWDPALQDWEEHEYQPGYRTERTRRDSVTWPGPRPE